MGLDLSCFKSEVELVRYIIDTPAQYISLSAESILTNCESFTEILKCQDTILFADGAGAVLSARVIHKEKLIKLPGCEVWLNVIKQSPSARIALIGAKQSVLDKTQAKLNSKYNANIVFSNSGYYNCENDLLNRLIKANPKFVFIAMGQPKQEILAKVIRKALPNTRVLGIGGSFDIFAGSNKRAPSIFIRLQLEWFYRLICQPTRIFRQKAVFKLSLKLLYLGFKNSLSHPK